MAQSLHNGLSLKACLHLIHLLLIIPDSSDTQEERYKMPKSFSYSKQSIFVYQFRDSESEENILGFPSF